MPGHHVAQLRLIFRAVPHRRAPLHPCSTLFLCYAVKEMYGRDAEFTEDGRDEQIGATEYAEGNGTRKRGRDAERITQG